MKYAFPAMIAPDDEGFMVTFDGLPGVTWGLTREQALREAADCLISSLSLYVDGGVAIPLAPPAAGRPVVTVTLLEAAKLALHDAMIAARVSNTELGRRLGLDEKAIRRLRDPLHGSKIETVEKALRELGTTAIVEFQVAA